MAFEISGKLFDIGPVQEVSAKFKKREFVIERKENAGGTVFVDYIKFQLIQDKCDLITGYSPGEEIVVFFNIKGNKWEKGGSVSYFTNLDAWRITRPAQGGDNVPPHTAADINPFLEDTPPLNEEEGDLPF